MPFPFVQAVHTRGMHFFACFQIDYSVNDVVHLICAFVTEIRQSKTSDKTHSAKGMYDPEREIKLGC